MGKITTQEEISKICEELKKQDKKIVTTNGCFDIFHTGHLQALKEAKKLGDILIVCINSDASVKQNKGDKRPINSQKDRAEIIAALECVDYTVIFEEKEPSQILSQIKPNIHTKAADYTIDKIIEKKTVEENGGEVRILNLLQGKSTTEIIKKIVDSYGAQRKAAFLDRDGTIIVDKEYMHKPEQLEFIPGAIDAIKQLNKKNYLVIIVTSQSGIGRGYYTEEDYHKFNQHFLQNLEKEGAKIDGVFFCPHHPTKATGKYLLDCECRKPKIGMIKQAQQEHKIELKHSWVIGDKTSDAKMGENAGCKSILVETGKAGRDEECAVKPTHKAKDLLDAVKILFANDND